MQNYILVVNKMSDFFTSKVDFQINKKYHYLLHAFELVWIPHKGMTKWQKSFKDGFPVMSPNNHSHDFSKLSM